MRRALMRKLALFIRTQVAIVTEPTRDRIDEQTAELSRVRAVVVEQTAELSKLRTLVEQNLRATENERRDMNETQRMAGVACARIENFIKIQKEYSIVIEQSIASLRENRLHIDQTA